MIVICKPNNNDLITQTYSIAKLQNHNANQHLFLPNRNRRKTKMSCNKNHPKQIIPHSSPFTPLKIVLRQILDDQCTLVDVVIHEFTGLVFKGHASPVFVC